MKTAAPFWASAALLAQRALSEATPTSTSAAPSCTASLITKLCSYPEPALGTAVADDTQGCFEYCNAHPPCSFFVYYDSGNPYMDSGDCWLYPGQSFDPSKGSSDCGDPYLYVYDKPVCSGGSPTDGCPAAASPTPIASVCGYKAPDCSATSTDGSQCIAVDGSSMCLTECGAADACAYAVFNSLDGSNSPYSSGNCWIFPTGKFDAAATTPCDTPNQFVYDNVCPKPSSSKTSSSPSATGSSAKSSASSGSGSSGSSDNKGTAGTTGSPSGNGTTGVAPASTSSSQGSAPTGFSVTSPLAIGVAGLLWHAL